MRHLTLFNRNARFQCSFFLERLYLLDEIDKIESTTEVSAMLLSYLCVNIDSLYSRTFYFLIGVIHELIVCCL